LAEPIRFPPYFERVFNTQARYIGLRGGRGSAKTWSVGGWLVLRHAHDPSETSVCIREVQRTIADSSKALIEKKIDEYGFNGLFDPQESRIKRHGGGDCIFRGMQNHTSDSIKSLEGRTFAWADEAHKLSKRSIELLTPTIRAPGSKLVFTWNPENEDDPVEKLFKENEGDPDFLCLTVNWYDNPWFPDELRKDMERDRKRDPDKYAHVWEGQYRGLSEARVFRNWREGEIDVAENVVWFYGMDFGFANDETAAIRCCMPDNETLYIDSEVYELGVPTDALPKFLGELPDATRWPMRADNARPETIDYLRRHGFPRLRAAKKGKGSVEDGVTFLQGMDIVIHPRCVNTIREFRSYAYKTDARTGEVLPAIEDKNNHAIDALRYAVEGLHRRGKRIVTPTPQPKRRRDYEQVEETNSWKVV
jgi:phage terminase large subunit